MPALFSPALLYFTLTLTDPALGGAPYTIQFFLNLDKPVTDEDVNTSEFGAEYMSEHIAR